MRKITTLLFGLLVLAACQQPQMANESALNTTGPDGILPLDGHAHQFPTDSSVKLMLNLATTAQLNQLNGDFGWGGSFPASAFRVSPDNQGVILWYAFRPGNDPQLFLALEQLREYDPRNLPKQPMGDELIVPTTIFHANPQSLGSESSIRDYIGSPSGDAPGWATLGGSVVRQYVLNADSLFASHPDTNGERFNHYMFGFFSARHESTFNEFVESAGENGYIRYYFGYDERDRPNRIRIILMAVTDRGVNQALAKKNDGDGGGSLQRSWPPPPDN